MLTPVNAAYTVHPGMPCSFYIMCSAALSTQMHAASLFFLQFPTSRSSGSCHQPSLVLLPVFHDKQGHGDWLTLAGCWNVRLLGQWASCALWADIDRLPGSWTLLFWTILSGVFQELITSLPGTWTFPWLIGNSIFQPLNFLSTLCCRAISIYSVIGIYLMIRFLLFVSVRQSCSVAPPILGLYEEPRLSSSFRQSSWLPNPHVKIITIDAPHA